MIQRLQTVYLFLAAALMAAFFFLQAATVITPEDTLIFTTMGAYSAAEPPALLFRLWPFTIVAALTVVLPLVDIFLFRNRPLQMRVAAITMLLLVVLYAVLGIYVYDLYIALNGSDLHFSASLTMPVVALVLNYIAYRRIRADERLVRSADRLR